MAGMLFAVTGANVGTATQSRWANTTSAGTITTAGGNITAVNINQTQLTGRWTTFFGNVSSFFALTDGTNTVYSWNATEAGQVCVSTKSSESFTSGTNISTSYMDTSFFGGAVTPDNSSATFTATCPTMVVGSVTMTNFLAAQVAGGTNFRTCAANTSATNSTNSYFFCVNINTAGTNYAGAAADYELLVPVNASASTTTYYFYAELD
ncbi:MAG: hypothetical protein QW568_02550 [Candidatus Anstonellaceae archaeon]